MHVYQVEKFYNKEIKKINVIAPKELVYLFYACYILEKSLQIKLVYFSNKQKLHEIVFNPYSTSISPDPESTPPGSTTEPATTASNKK